MRRFTPLNARTPAMIAAVSTPKVDKLRKIYPERLKV
jgi:hypothetical protein